MSPRMLLQIAVRNLGRQRRRTAFAIGILAAALLAVLFTRAWQNGMVDLIDREGAGTWLGAVQIRPKGAAETKDAFSLSPSFAVDQTVREKLLAVPNVTAVSPRIRFFGRLYKGDDSAPFVGLGTEVATAQQVVPRLLERERLESGEPLRADSSGEVLIASPLAASLNLHPGDTVTLVARPEDGGLEGVDVKVAGIFRAAFEEDQKRAVVVDLLTAQKLLRMEGRANVVIAAVSPLPKATQVAAQIQKALPDIEALPWDQVNLRHRDAKAIWALSLGVIFGVVSLVALLGLLTTLTLIVSERRKEIGTLGALGMPRSALLAMFVAEGGLLGAMGGVVGALLAAGLVHLVSIHGVRFTPPESFTVFVRPSLGPVELFVGVAIATALSALLTVFPAVSAARRSPLESLS